ncbi:riboflavin synthase [Fructobacillus sp. M2-14]|uniref:Riboflavin synthase n=1 Tax=Fructobacillus broussonetiae TaxID=2713173 RepID=A0ABS5R0V3_9LACO|nr:riboflavin synthase [Fructobacillus broussonetiae]MBS9338144.1 riboflavin synthase [Fructobacillus broussonetiae]
MFTGITEEVGRVQEIIKKNEKEWHLTVKTPSPFFAGLPLGASVMNDGVCLSIVESTDDCASFDVMVPTYETTIVSDYEVGTSINLERSLPVNGRLDGHFVLGHVDGTAQLVAKKQDGETVFLQFHVADENLVPEVVAKGSVAVSGVSLTVIGTDGSDFTVGLIPTTLEKTNLSGLEVGNFVNLETDILAKYLQKKVGNAYVS